MSLILEALKKSEAERQLGRAPGLMSPMVRVSRRRGVSPWWGVLALAVVVAGAAAWWLNTQPAREASSASAASRDASDAGSARDPASTAAPARDASTSATQAQDAGDVGATASTRLAAKEARMPAPTLDPTPGLPASPVVPEPLEHAAVLPHDPQFDSVERESMPVATQPTPAPPAPGPATMASTVTPIPAQTARTVRDTVPPSSTPAASPTAPALPSPALPSSSTAALQTPPTIPSRTPSPAPHTSPSTSAPAVSATQATTAANPMDSNTAARPTDLLPTVDTSLQSTPPPPAEPSLEPLPSLAELLPDLRNALPPLKVSMHAYGATPASRFVLIDGKRYVPGDRVNASLVVEDIRRDGAVLDANGKRFLVPRP